MKRPLTLFVLLISTSFLRAEDGRELVDFFQDPYKLGFVIALLFLALALYTVNTALNALRDAMKPKTEAAAEATLSASAPQNETIWQALTKATPIEKEADILLDHDYDGIHELDNRLPPWWLWGFYFTIIFAVVYMIRFHIAGGPGSDQEFQNEMASAKTSVENYLKTASNLIDESTVVLLSEEGRIAAGKKIFETNCVACHAADGGGLVGPNLTDEYWIHGGGINNVFKVIKYGVPAKGMISWKDQLNPSQMQEVASYILSLKGSSPANPKAAEGEIWQEAGAEASEKQADTTTTAVEGEEVAIN